MKSRGWQAHEAYVQEVLGLDSTIASGNKFYDQGDAVDRSHLYDNDFAIVADAKYTEAKSFSIKAELLYEWDLKAKEMGKRFILPIRFWQGGLTKDYVIMGLDDFQELREKAR